MDTQELPSERSILRGTLLPPSALPTVISRKDFIALFPASLREHPQIALLYRELQHQRSLDLDFVKTNIESEAKRGERQQRQLYRTKARGAGGSQGLDVDESAFGDNFVNDQDTSMDGILYSHHEPSAYEPHTLTSILPAMDRAIAFIEAEVEELDAKSDHLRTQLEATIGNLSDLRYGKLNRPALGKEIMESLQSFSAECDSRGASNVKFDGNGKISGR